VCLGVMLVVTESCQVLYTGGARELVGQEERRQEGSRKHNRRIAGCELAQPRQRWKKNGCQLRAYGQQ
jgi:hypothetical protein